jgi:hypothetical protein
MMPGQFWLSVRTSFVAVTKPCDLFGTIAQPSVTGLCARGTRRGNGNLQRRINVKINSDVLTTNSIECFELFD